MHKGSCKFLYKKIRGGPVIGIASFCLYGSKALAIGKTMCYFACGAVRR